MEAGIYYDMPEDEYHGSDALSVSGMKTILHKSPRHYEHQVLNGQRKVTDAMLFGRAFHSAVLEPDVFAGEYVVAPSLNRSQKESCVNYLNWLSENCDFQEVFDTGKKLSELKTMIDFNLAHFSKTIISVDNMHLISAMATAINAKSSAKALLKASGTNETSLFYREDGITFRIRFDRLLGAHVGVDIKTTQDASPEGFQRHAYNYGYHMQAAFYKWVYERVTGEELQDFVFICVEKDAPHCVGLYRASPEMLELGWHDCQQAIDKYKAAKKRGIFFDYDDKIIPLGLPRYAENRLTFGD